MLHWTLRDWRVQLLIVLLWDGVCASEVKPTIKPLFSRKPFLFAWNIPTQQCGSRYGVPLQLDQFQVVTTPSQDSVGQKLTLFYHNRLGLYPFYKADGTAVHGGIPQIGNLSQHLSEMQKGVDKYIPNPDSVGLAVIDWEEWRPLWVRNWGGKDIYRVRSRELVQQKNPTWSEKQVKEAAQQEYEMSGKKFMQETLRHAKHLRPNNLWGYYLFPDCYNHDYMKSMEGYTGRCPDLEMARNDQLEWLFAESTALFPSIYLRKMLTLTSAARLFVRNRVKEGMHRASSSDEVARPVFVYVRPVYVDSPQYMPEFDLVSTIGESVALGAAGIIMWGDVAHAKNKALQAPFCYAGSAVRAHLPDWLPGGCRRAATPLDQQRIVKPIRR
ncbi:hyaluronidase-2-like isoform X2 [Gambusia affinis]|uniref:hyaluronidase-2-like isoform X2 n=1 Tax=Gambusia affinis TaxID=33528 RepID=UPI001CDCF2F0|nr:hyaluronidase-2-like isoform X2 [Gambusia affinis]